MTKYKTRNGISSKDLLRLSHPKPSDLGKRKREAEVDDMQLVLHFAAHMDEEVSHILKHSISVRMGGETVSCHVLSFSWLSILHFKALSVQNF